MLLFRSVFRHACLVLCVFTAFSWTSLRADDAASPEDLRFFESKIRPVLVERCYRCHSDEAAKAGKLEAGLRLDTRAATRKGGDSGPAVVPGDVKSLLIKAIRHESIQMPPDTKLAPQVIADFVTWVERGAADPRDGEAATDESHGMDIEQSRDFWSFRPLVTTAPPKSSDPWVRNAIDAFLLGQMEKQQIRPNDAVAREQLIRRAYFDLWGLAPTPDAVKAFVKDPTDDAYEKLVEQLLEGPHYGERWARHWLDLARFAESNGYAFDKDRNAAFHYRDFVIRALNSDMPYDQFVQLQLAGDQLDPQNSLAQAATGFLAAGPFTSQQTQKERERSRYEQLDDIVGTIGTSMLGLTIGCARCHDHKFDPLPTKDYYRFTACFAETGFQDFDYDPNPEKTKADLEKFNQAHKPLTDARLKYEKEELPKKLEAWIASRSDAPSQEKLGPWFHIGPFKAADFKKAFDTAFAPEKNVDLTKPLGDLKWTEQAKWTDGTVHNTLAGDNAANYLYRTIETPSKMQLEVSLGRDDGLKLFLNKKAVLTKEVMGAAAPDQDKVTLSLKPGVNHLLLKVVNGGGPSGFYFSTKPTTPKNIQDILAIPAEKRNKQQKDALLKWFGPRDPVWAEMNQKEQEHLKKKPQPKITKIFAARKNGATYNFGANTRKVFFLARGNSDAKLGQAPPGFLQVLTESQTPPEHWLQSKQADDSETDKPNSVPPRVALARWMTDADGGAGALLARVAVNRLWQHHFGRGLVSTPSDFGQQGARPTHPELLDFLASELVRNEWKLKPIHKLIMNSAAYRMSVSSNPQYAKIDPENKLWWRRPARRLEAEIIRDSLLAASGTLDLRMYGKGSLNEADTRRSVYLTVKRSNLIPFLQLFDAPDSIQGIGNRNLTTVPPQALVMMNSPLVRQLATKFADRLQGAAATAQQESESDSAELVNQAYWIALSRPPNEQELGRMTEFLQHQQEAYEQGGQKPAESKKRAITDFSQMMFCLNEFIFVD